MEKLNHTGFCNTCSIEVEDNTYLFCSIECRDVWVVLKEKYMGQYDIDKDLYTKWLEDKLVTIEAMTTREEIEARINEIAKIEFFAKREWAMLHQQYDKITGRKGIAPWLKTERDKLITDPNIQVNWDGEPRKKEKKPKEDQVKNLLGFDIKELIQSTKSQAKGGNKSISTPAPKEEKISIDDAILSLTESTPKPEVKKATPEEIKAKADALKEKVRLAQLAKQQKAAGE